MKFRITCIALVFFLPACEDDNDNKPVQLQWKKLGLDGKIVNEMQLTSSNLYVATTTGLFKKQIISAESEFQSMGFGSKNVEAIQVIDDAEIIVSLFDKTGSEEPALFKTTDAGENWMPINSDIKLIKHTRKYLESKPILRHPFSVGLHSLGARKTSYLLQIFP